MTTYIWDIVKIAFEVGLLVYLGLATSNGRRLRDIVQQQEVKLAEIKVKLESLEKNPGGAR